MIRSLLAKLFGFQKIIEELEKKVKELSWDETFGMWTRTAFLQFCRVMPRGPRTLAFIDLDDIHELNYKYGYTNVNTMVKSAFSIPFRRSDIVARWYSGDEIVILFDSDYEGGKRKMKELCKKARQHDITFQYELGIWEVGKTGVVNVIDGLANINSEYKMRREPEDGIGSNHG